MEKAEESVHVYRVGSDQTRVSQRTNALAPLIQSRARGKFGTILSSTLVFLCFLPRRDCLRYPVEFTGFSARRTSVIWHCFKRQKPSSSQLQSKQKTSLRFNPADHADAFDFGVNLSDSGRSIVNTGHGRISKHYQTTGSHLKIAFS